MSISILHLSDLHLSVKASNEQRRLIENLLEDIKVNSIKIDVVAITGDLIDKGNEDNWKEAEKFIDRLCEVTELKVDNFVITQGNHDVPRKLAFSVIKDVRENPTMIDSSIIQLMDLRNNEYKNFLEKICYDISKNNHGFEVKCFDIGGKKICFNVINSSWSTFDNNDYQKMIIGKDFLDDNLEKVRECKSDLTITMMHHPFNWFISEEKELLLSYLQNEKYFNSPIVLHGHIHEASISAQETPFGKTVSLISGIGYPEKEKRINGQEKMASCRYSIYTIDLDRQRIDCQCRKSIDTGDFVPDVELYRGSENGHYFINYDNRCIKPIIDDKTIFDNVMLDDVPLVKDWAGRKEELEKLKSPGNHIFFISGVGGQGKTALAAQYFTDFSNDQAFVRKIWIDCREIDGTIQTKLIQLLNREYGEKEDAVKYKDEPYKDTVKRFIKEMLDKKYLIVFDNVDAYIDIEAEELTYELQTLVDAYLETKAESIIVFTCRTSIYNASSNYYCMKLDGLKENEGLEFFQNRTIDISQEDDIRACKKIIQLTKGHPWWLGLIAGQIKSEKMSPSRYLEQNENELKTTPSKLDKFFSQIWEKLKLESTNVLIYLAESSRPLSVEELSILSEKNYNQTNKVIRKLKNLSLVIEHSSKDRYHVHPLIREFVQKKYSTDFLKNYIEKLLEIMMGPRICSIIFAENITENGLTLREVEPEAIIDAIETCLNSNENTKALSVLSYCFGIISESICTSRIIALSERVIKAIDWGKEKVTEVRYKATFISNFLDILSMQDGVEEKLNYYLLQYESNCSKNSIPYTCYLSTKAYVLWRRDAYDEAELCLQEYDMLAQKCPEVWNISDIENLRGMIMRDKGNIEEALGVFESVYDSAAKYGNMARCYLKKEDYCTALFYLAKSVKVLCSTSSLSNEINKGYAYLWIAEAYFEIHQEEKAHIFLLSAQEKWKENAPYLLSKTQDLMRKLGKYEIEFVKDVKKRLLEELFSYEIDNKSA